MKRFSTSFTAAIAVTLLLSVPVCADTKKLSDEQRQELIRGLSREWATAKVILPMSEKALPFEADGTWDEKEWKRTTTKNGPAARPGDVVQITKIEIGDDKIKIELNDGSKKEGILSKILKGGSLQGATRPKTNAQMGTSIEIHFRKSIGEVNSAGVKKILGKVLDFSGRSAGEVYLETLPEPIREAIKAERPAVGMDKEQLLMAMGQPEDKQRYSESDEEYEVWIYGHPPGIIRFVRFLGSKVDKVDEHYAGINGSIARPDGDIR